MKLRILLFAALFWAKAALCQNGPNGYLPNYDPPSPEASALGKFVDHPVGKFTGTPKIDVPLFNIKVGRIELPISLSYHGSGVRVNDVASRVGTGWVLNAGGVITRTVKGYPDDVYYGGKPLQTTILTYFNGGSQGTVSEVPGNSGTFTTLYDLQPDEFFYNFNGKMGKMYFTDVTNAHLINDDPLRVSSPFREDNNGFTITDEKGIVYSFQNVEKEDILVAQGDDYLYQSSWFLSQIYDPVTNETVSFQYQTNRPTLNYSVIKSYSSNPPCTIPNVATENSSQVQISQSQVLSRITYNGGYIEFDANLNRSDLPNDVAYTKISQYVTSGSNPVLSKGYNLSYTTTNTGSGAQNGGSCRLYLNSVQEFGSDNTSLLTPYTFFYKNASSLPDRGSPQQDVWGYYNANGAATTDPPQFAQVWVHNHGNQTDYLPFNTNDPSDPPTQIISGVNCSSNAATADDGSLSKIVYPTGGYTTYTYELNQFGSSTPFSIGVYSGGGIRIREVDDYSSAGQQLLSKTYQYLGGFLAGAYPQVAYPKSDGSLIRFSLNQAALGSCDGNYVGYGEVTESQISTGGANNGITVDDFTTDKDVPGTFTTLNYCSDISSNVFQESYYPFFDWESREERRGKLTSERVFDSSGNPRKAINCSYTLVSNPIVNVNASYMTFGPFDDVSQTTPVVESIGQTSTIRAEKLLLTSKTEHDYDGPAPAPQAPSDTSITLYTYCGGAHSDQFLRSETNYSSGGLIPNSLNPAGPPIALESTQTSFTYPFDYNSSASGGIMSAMVSMNYISPQIGIFKTRFSSNTSSRYSTNYYTEGQLNDYMYNPFYGTSEPNMIVPKQIFVLNLAAPVQQPNSTVEVSDPSNPGALYERRLIYLGYDAYSNPTAIQHDNQFEALSWSVYGPLLSHAHTTNPGITPVSSQLTTYAYDSLLRLNSITDPGNKIRTFEYDVFSRLMNVKDNNNNILTHTDYHYQGQ